MTAHGVGVSNFDRSTKAVVFQYLIDSWPALKDNVLCFKTLLFPKSTKQTGEASVASNKSKKSKVDAAFDKIIEMTKDGQEVIQKFDDSRVVYTFNSKGDLILEEKAINNKKHVFRFENKLQILSGLRRKQHGQEG